MTGDVDFEGKTVERGGSILGPLAQQQLLKLVPVHRHPNVRLVDGDPMAIFSKSGAGTPRPPFASTFPFFSSDWEEW